MDVERVHNQDQDHDPRPRHFYTDDTRPTDAAADQVCAAFFFLATNEGRAPVLSRRALPPSPTASLASSCGCTAAAGLGPPGSRSPTDLRRELSTPVAVF